MLRTQLHLLISCKKINKFAQSILALQRVIEFCEAQQKCKSLRNSLFHWQCFLMYNLFYLNPTCKRNSVIKKHFQFIAMDMTEITQTEDMKHM